MNEVHVCQCKDEWTKGCRDAWTYDEYLDVWTYDEYLDVWTCGCSDVCEDAPTLKLGFFPSGLLATLFWQAASFAFCPWRKPLIALIVWIVGNLRMCVFSQSVCALWPALSMAFMIVLSAMLWFLRPLGVPKHFVHGNSAKMVGEFTFLRKDQVHCPGCSDVVTGKRSNMFIQKSSSKLHFHSLDQLGRCAAHRRIQILIRSSTFQLANRSTAT